MDKVFSTYQVAHMCHVHHTTVINWINEGVLAAYTTPGGHRRVKNDDFLDFMERYKMPLPDAIKRQKEQKMRILIVDDDPDALMEYKEALADCGCLLDFALNGFEAGRKIYSRKPDLIILDFKLPGMDGFQVCEVLHRDTETTGIPIIAVTVLNKPEDIQRIKEFNVKEYLCKPVDIEKLKKLIQTMLGNEQYATK